MEDIWVQVVAAAVIAAKLNKKIPEEIWGFFYLSLMATAKINPKSPRRINAIPAIDTADQT